MRTGYAAAATIEVASLFSVLFELLTVVVAITANGLRLMRLGSLGRGLVELLTLLVFLLLFSLALLLFFLLNYPLTRVLIQVCVQICAPLKAFIGIRDELALIFNLLNLVEVVLQAF